SQQSQSGDSSQQSQSGDYSKQSQSGNSSQQSQSGDYSKQSQSGNYSQQSQSGDYSKQSQSGDYSKQEILGKNSVAVSAGYDCQIKGKIGCWIALTEWKIIGGVWIPICVKSGKIDGKKLKEDVWYKLENKKFVEVK
ncbi:MAG: hypothetical protein WC554_08390, partial [Clostridia bacterium]